MKLTLKERDITAQIRDYLRLKKVEFFKHWGGPMGEKGISDIIGTLPGGRALYIEVKTEIGKVSPEQTAFLERMGRNGALAFVARSLEEVMERVGL